MLTCVQIINYLKSLLMCYYCTQRLEHRIGTIYINILLFIVPVGLWGVVNNAGVGGPAAPVEFYTRADYQGVLDVNLLGMIEVTRVFLPLIKASQGRIVNMCSAAGLVSTPGVAPYISSKFAVRGWSEALR